MNEEEQQAHPRQQELEDVVTDNQAIHNEMARLGARIDMSEVQGSMLQTFIRWTLLELSGGDEDRYRDLAIDFEIFWQKTVNVSLRETRKKVKQQRLMAGGHQPKKLFVPGQGE